MIKNAEDEWIKDLEVIKLVFMEFYHKLYTIEIEVNDLFKTTSTFPTLNLVNELSLEINPDDIRKVTFVMALWKSTGPNGSQ